MWAGDVETPEDWRHRREQKASARASAADARKNVFSRYQDVTPSFCAEIIALLQCDMAPLDQRADRGIPASVHKLGGKQRRQSAY